MSEKVPGEKPGLLIHYTLDGEIQTTTVEAMTPREVLSEAGFDPESVALVEVKAGHRRPCFNLDEPIPIHEHAKFISAPAPARTPE